MSARLLTRTKQLHGLHVNFGGLESHITTPTLAQVSRTLPFTICALIKRNGDPPDSTHNIFNYSTSVTDRIGFRMRSGSGAGVVEYSQFTGTYTSRAANRLGFNDGAWHWVGVTNEGTGISGVKLYANGQDVSSATTGTQSQSLSTNYGTGYVGYQATASVESYFDLCDLRIYSRVLTADEFYSMYHAMLSGDLNTFTDPLDSLVLRYWLQDNVESCLDSSGNGNDGTWVNYDPAVWEIDKRLPFSPAHRLGCSIDDTTGQTIPRDDSSWLVDVNGDPLEFPAEASEAADKPTDKAWSIGNSLLADALPEYLGDCVGRVINNGEGLSYHVANLSSSANDYSYLASDALNNEYWDWIVLQPYNEDPLQDLATDVANAQVLIDLAVARNPSVKVLIHEGFAPASSVAAGTVIDAPFDGDFAFSNAYFDTLLATLRANNPGLDIRLSFTNRAMFVLGADLAAGTNPLLIAAGFDELGSPYDGGSIYRDNQHIRFHNRFFVTNCCRRAMGKAPVMDVQYISNPTLYTISQARQIYFLDVIRRTFEEYGAVSNDLTLQQIAGLLPTNFGVLGINSSGHVLRVVENDDAVTAAEIEAALVDDGDATALLQAIADKIAGDLTAGDFSALAIVQAIKNDATLAQMIARIDAAVTTRMPDDVQAVSDQVAADLATAHGAGSWESGAGTGTGARTVTVTVDDGTDPLESARVRLTKGAETYIGSTDVSGQIEFSIDDGTWTVAITLYGHTFTPTTLVVDGDETPTYSMTAATITPPASPDAITAVYHLTDSDLADDDGVSVYYRMITPPTGSGIGFQQAWEEVTSDANGDVSIPVIPGAEYELAIGGTGADYCKFRTTIDGAATNGYLIAPNKTYQVSE